MKYAKTILPAAAVTAAILAGCTPTIKTENEVTIKPIQITLDVNLKVDQELNQALSTDKPNVKADPNSSDVRERRRSRRDQIKAWKSAQLIGENNTGLLEARTADGSLSDSVKKVVDAENADRRLVFQAIAGKQNIPVESVAQRMGARMAERSAEGTWVQDGAGKWTVKAGK